MRASLLFLALPLTGTAFAQGGVNYGRPLETPENQADMALRGAARCAYTSVPASVRKVLETNIGSDEEAKRAKALRGVARNCFPHNWPSLSSTALRHALSEVSYRETYRLGDPAPEAAPLPASFAVRGSDAPATPEQGASRYLGALAGCAVFAAPRQAREWIMGPRNVDEEQRRFAAMAPAIQQCAGAQANAALTARNFRGPVATALYERAHSGQGK